MLNYYILIQQNPLLKNGIYQVISKCPVTNHLLKMQMASSGKV